MKELLIDNFAGGGGASLAIEQATGRSIDIAINHDPAAIATHKANHPHTLHYCENVWDVDPREVAKGRPVGLAWFSPDCKHFSKAKGGNPVEKKIRGLAWVVLRYAAIVKPRLIFLENVEEFTTWGPLVVDKDGNSRPCPDRKGQTFDSFIRALERHGYKVEKKELRACDYGAPTIRKRLFMVARCDGRPIVWPAPTHGEEKLPFKTAAECIDWSIPAPSIFERNKPLAEATCRRIAKGIMRYVVNTLDPFIVTYYGDKAGEFRGQPLDEPLRTQTTENRHGLVVPFLSSSAYSKTTGRGKYIYRLSEPVRTITSTNDKILVAPLLTEFANASKQRNFAADTPLRTQCAQTKGGHFALVSAFLAKHYTGVVGSDLKDSLGTVTSKDHHSLVAAHLVRPFGQSVGQSPEEPAPTVMPGGAGKTGLVTSHIVKMKGQNIGQDNRTPLHTITAGGLHFGEVRAFLLKYYGTNQAPNLKDPMHTVTTKERFGLVTVRGIDYMIVDIGLRMLSPRELFRAQGFPDSYIIDTEFNGKPMTKTAQVRMCGNSVSPYPAKALIEANYKAEEATQKRHRFCRIEQRRVREVRV